ncbi:cytochrome P450 [Sorangium sp. So ce269]
MSVTASSPDRERSRRIEGQDMIHRRSIPQPTRIPVIGNITQIDGDAFVQSMMRLAREYGPIYALEFFSRRFVVVSSHELVNELCDEKRFDKLVDPPIEGVRDFLGDGLFTAHTDEPNWGKAHRILMPAFGPLGIREMFDPMLDIAEQLMLRWERFGESAVIDVADQMTRLTLDTIALCAFDYRFNSFYQNGMHPFVDAMVGGLLEAGARGRRPALVSRAMLGTARRYEADIRLMHNVADQLIAKRRKDPNAGAKNDLLGRMLSARDPMTGERLSDENIRYQMATFLVAGHETTSGLLSFALYLLLENPDVLARTRAIVDDVLGNESPRLEHLPQLRFVEQVLMEALRLWPTAPVFTVHAREATMVGGHSFGPEDSIKVLIPMLHRDPAVWGPDVEAFRPERFDREAEAKLPPNAWKPFGNGQRACIGRPFAMQEALLVLSMILQRFDLIAHDPSYQLRIKETLTMKPEGFRIHAKARNQRPFRQRGAVASAPQKPLQRRRAAAAQQLEGEATPLLVLFGSNTGSSEAFAQRIGSDAPAHGFGARVAPMDEYAGRLPPGGAVVVVTASYEGQPPDNARQFVAALDGLEAGDLAGTHYAVFGCGNRQWARTYQAIPTRVDEALAAAGATRIRARGEADASGDFFGAFDAWYATLWADLTAALGKTVTVIGEGPAVTVELVTRGRAATLRQDELRVGQLVVSRELVDMTSPLGRSKRHFEIELPEGMTYRSGDYLAVLPRNPPANVDRVMRRFGFAPDTQLVLHRRAATLTTLPTEYPIAVGELLASYVELAQPATRAQVRELAAATRCPPDKRALEALAEEAAYARDVLGKRVSVLDLLERFAACELPFERFLATLPPLQARSYSIASSPLWNERRCALCVAIVDAPAMSGQGRFLGVASNHLASAAVGSRLAVAVRPSQRHFHPPEDPQTPMVMIGAGTGLAPFRGFLQERAAQAQAGRAVGPSLLFFGCDHPDADLLYKDELDAWQRAGIVDVRPAFTFAQEDGVAFVQDRVWKDRADVAKLFREGAVVYVCGDGKRMAPAVRATLARIYCVETGMPHEEALRMVEQIERERGRFVEDVFS